MKVEEAKVAAPGVDTFCTANVTRFEWGLLSVPTSPAARTLPTALPSAQVAGWKIWPRWLKPMFTNQDGWLKFGGEASKSLLEKATREQPVSVAVVGSSSALNISAAR